MSKTLDQLKVGTQIWYPGSLYRPCRCKECGSDDSQEVYCYEGRYAGEITKIEEDGRVICEVPGKEENSTTFHKGVIVGEDVFLDKADAWKAANELNLWLYGNVKGMQEKTND